MENVNSNNVNNNVNNNEPKKKGGIVKILKVAGVTFLAGFTAYLVDDKYNNGRGAKWIQSTGKKLVTKTPAVEQPTQPQYQRRDFNNGQRFDRHHGGNGNKPAMNNNQQ